MLTLDRGRMKGLVPVRGPQAAGDRHLRLRVASDPVHARAVAARVEGVTAVRGVDAELEVAWSRDEDAQADLVRALVEAGVGVVSLEATAARMQDVYMTQVERGGTP
jgi:hypothetical protein